ncbi:MAG: DUF2760 domain-containing protein [Pirellulales bacterium]|nr:DUF2760 domain-containing protein [Pirellulales bacterium]
MSRILLAFRAFFAVLFDAGAARAVSEALARGAVSTAAPPAASPEPPQAPAATRPAPKPVRSDALSLLAALQREGRLLDFLKEPIAGYSDAQIGAAVREVHRGCAGVVERFFDPRPIVDQPEGASISLPAPLDAARFHLVGNAAGQASGGLLRHHGWEAARCELPQWTGAADAARLIAPAEVECR